MASTSNQIDLPGEIVLEILLRLPVKSLLKFKCVCKCWYTLIESASFVNWHYVHEKNREHLLIWHCRPIGDYNHGLSLDVTLCKYEEPDRLRMPLRVLDLKGPVNGIYCVLSCWWRMALWNPARKQFRPLPFSHLDIQLPLAIFDDAIGFGMDLLSCDYKVVWIRCLWNKEEDEQYYPSVVSVYNSRSDSWRHFEDELVDSTHSSYRSLYNTYLNGIYYFLTMSYENYISILAFDMSSEMFREIKVPDCIERVRNIVAYGDSIALLTRDFDEKFVVWLMEEEGRWVKKFYFRPFQDVTWKRSLGLWDKNKFLFQNGNLDLNLFNVNTKELRSVEAPKKKCENDHSFIYWVNSYKESLFSLEGEGHNCGPFDASSDLVKDFFEIPSSFSPHLLR